MPAPPLAQSSLLPAVAPLFILIRKLVRETILSNRSLTIEGNRVANSVRGSVDGSKSASSIDGQFVLVSRNSVTNYKLMSKEQWS